MTLVLDASAFFGSGDGAPRWVETGERCLTAPSVVDEVRDAAARCRLALALERGLAVLAPSADSLASVEAAAVASGDADRLSRTDRDLLALALEHAATLVTDDFALQNAAARLKVACRPIARRRPAPRRRGWRCTGCGRFGDGPGDCPVCGAAIEPVRRGRR
ncbi:MAG: nucleotide-binding protein [Methanospirillum sp.]|nr:nucleotide-binding protein [Methanospirillum sp.]